MGDFPHVPRTSENTDSPVGPLASAAQQTLTHPAKTQLERHRLREAPPGPPTTAPPFAFPQHLYFYFFNYSYYDLNF